MPPSPACRSPQGSPQYCSSEPSLQSGCPSHCGLGFFTQLRSSHWKVKVPQGTPGIEGVGAGLRGWVPEPKGVSKTRPGKTEPGRGQEATGEGSLDRTKGFPEAPLRSPKGRPCPLRTPRPPYAGLLREGSVSPLRPGLLTVRFCFPPGMVPEGRPVPPLSAQ